MPALDGVRGLAIVLVLFYHMTDPDLTRDLAPWRWVVRNFGWCGVDLFFVQMPFHCGDDIRTEKLAAV
jgi:peptidoglycan/LPS O-acetylase OafA/YrhL